VSSTTAILAGAISANSVQAAPVGLAAAITATALSGKITATVSAATKTMTTLQKIFTAATAATAVGVIIYAIHLQNQIQALQQRQTSLLEQLQQLQQERDDATNQLAMLVDENNTLKANSMELLRLRAEVTRLRQHDNSIQAVTNNAQAMPILIHIKSRLLSIPDEDLQSIGIGWTAIPQGGQMGYLETPQIDTLLGALTDVSNVTVLGMPEVQSINGQEVSMSMTKSFQLNDLTETNLGEIVEARPFYSTNSSTFDLSFDAELKQLTGDAAQPMVQVVEITNEVTFAAGKTLVLEQSIPPGSWSPDATNMPPGPRDLLIFVTPTAVDSRDLPIYQQ
jgi:cell division protein FtsL